MDVESILDGLGVRESVGVSVAGLLLAVGATLNLFGTVGGLSGLLLVQDVGGSNLGAFLCRGSVVSLLAQLGSMFSVTGGTLNRVNVTMVSGVVVIDNQTSAGVTLSARVI